MDGINVPISEVAKKRTFAISTVVSSTLMCAFTAVFITIIYKPVGALRYLESTQRLLDLIAVCLFSLLWLGLVALFVLGIREKRKLHRMCSGFLVVNETDVKVGSYTISRDSIDVLKTSKRSVSIRYGPKGKQRTLMFPLSWLPPGAGVGLEQVIRGSAK